MSYGIENGVLSLNWLILRISFEILCFYLFIYLLLSPSAGITGVSNLADTKAQPGFLSHFSLQL